MEKELREAVTDLCQSDELAAEVVLRFIHSMNADPQVQSPASMMHHLTTALVEREDSMEQENREAPPPPPPLVRATTSG